MIRLVPTVFLLLLLGCGESGLPERRNDEIRVTGTGVAVDISGTAEIGVSGSYD